MIIGANNQLKIKRMQVVNGKEVYPDTYHLETLDVYIYPLEYQIAVMFDEQNAYRTFKVIADGAQDISEGDLAVDLEGNEYTVKGVEIRKNNLDTGDITQFLLIKTYRKNAA